MAGFRVAVTNEHIAAAGPAPGPDAGPDFVVPHDPVEIALAAATGREVMCDADVDPVGEMATIGQGNTTLVVRLPAGVHEWINAWYDGQPVEPFDFYVEVEDWLPRLLWEEPQMVVRGRGVED